MGTCASNEQTEITTMKSIKSGTNPKMKTMRIDTAKISETNDTFESEFRIDCDNWHLQSICKRLDKFWRESQCNVKGECANKGYAISDDSTTICCSSHFEETHEATDISTSKSDQDKSQESVLKHFEIIEEKIFHTMNILIALEKHFVRQRIISDILKSNIDFIHIPNKQLRDLQKLESELDTQIENITSFGSRPKQEDNVYHELMTYVQASNELIEKLEKIILKPMYDLTSKFIMGRITQLGENKDKISEEDIEDDSIPLPEIIFNRNFKVLLRVVQVDFLVKKKWKYQGKKKDGSEDEEIDIDIQEEESKHDLAAKSSSTKSVDIHDYNLIKEQREELDSKVSELTSKIKEFEAKLANLEEERNKLIKNAEEIKKEKDQLSNNTQMLKREKDSLKENTENLHKEIDALKKNEQLLSNSLAQLKESKYSLHSKSIQVEENTKEETKEDKTTEGLTINVIKDPNAISEESKVPSSRSINDYLKLLQYNVTLTNKIWDRTKFLDLIKSSFFNMKCSIGVSVNKQCDGNAVFVDESDHAVLCSEHYSLLISEKSYKLVKLGKYWKDIEEMCYLLENELAKAQCDIAFLRNNPYNIKFPQYSEETVVSINTLIDLKLESLMKIAREIGENCVLSSFDFLKEHYSSIHRKLTNITKEIEELTFEADVIYKAQSIIECCSSLDSESNEDNSQKSLVIPASAYGKELTIMYCPGVSSQKLSELERCMNYPSNDMNITVSSNNAEVSSIYSANKNEELSFLKVSGQMNTLRISEAPSRFDSFLDKGDLALEEESKLNINDYLFITKDEQPFYFDSIMEFVCQYRLKPSKELELEYSSNELAESLDLPDYDTLNKEIGIPKNVYNKLKSQHSSLGKFKYNCNTIGDVVSSVSENKSGVKIFELTQRKGENSVKDGVGMQIWANGRIYEGYFKNNQQHYLGRYIFEDGAVQEGEFKNRLRDGYCECIDRHGNSFKGQFKNNKEHGHGDLYVKTEGYRIIGEWENGQKHGRFKVIHDDGVELALNYDQGKQI